MFPSHRSFSQAKGTTGGDAINGADWLANVNAASGSDDVSVTQEKAGISAINVGSNKSIIGIGSREMIKGNVLIVEIGAKNAIIITSRKSTSRI